MSTALTLDATGPNPEPPLQIPVAEGPIPDMERLYRDCLEAGIECSLGGQECCSGGSCGPKAALLVAPNALGQYRRFMQESWANALAREGSDPEVLARIQAAEQAGEAVCPACGHVGEPVEGECGDCGLALG